MKTIEVSEDALESVRAMAIKLQEERDMLLAACKEARIWWDEGKSFALKATLDNVIENVEKGV